MFGVATTGLITAKDELDSDWKCLVVPVVTAVPSSGIRSTKVSGGFVLVR